MKNRRNDDCNVDNLPTEEKEEDNLLSLNEDDGALNRFTLSFKDENLENSYIETNEKNMIKSFLTFNIVTNLIMTSSCRRDLHKLLPENARICVIALILFYLVNIITIPLEIYYIRKINSGKIKVIPSPMRTVYFIISDIFRQIGPLTIAATVSPGVFGKYHVGGACAYLIITGIICSNKSFFSTLLVNTPLAAVILTISFYYRIFYVDDPTKENYQEAMTLQFIYQIISLIFSGLFVSFVNYVREKNRRKLHFLNQKIIYVTEKTRLKYSTTKKIIKDILPVEYTKILINQYLPKKTTSSFSSLNFKNFIFSEKIPKAFFCQLDIVDFSVKSRFLNCLNLVRILNNFFSSLDSLCHKFEFSKIKTSGDGYLALKKISEEEEEETNNNNNDKKKEKYFDDEFEYYFQFIKSILFCFEILRIMDQEINKKENFKSPKLEFDSRIGLCVDSGFVVLWKKNTNLINFDIFGKGIQKVEKLEQLCPRNGICVDFTMKKMIEKFNDLFNHSEEIIKFSKTSNNSNNNNNKEFSSKRKTFPPTEKEEEKSEKEEKVFTIKKAIQKYEGLIKTLKYIKKERDILMDLKNISIENYFNDDQQQEEESISSILKRKAKKKRRLSLVRNVLDQNKKKISVKHEIKCYFNKLVFDYVSQKSFYYSWVVIFLSISKLISIYFFFFEDQYFHLFLKNGGDGNRSLNTLFQSSYDQKYNEREQKFEMLKLWSIIIGCLVLSFFGLLCYSCLYFLPIILPLPLSCPIKLKKLRKKRDKKRINNNNKIMMDRYLKYKIIIIIIYRILLVFSYLVFNSFIFISEITIIKLGDDIQNLNKYFSVFLIAIYNQETFTGSFLNIVVFKRIRIFGRLLYNHAVEEDENSDMNQEDPKKEGEEENSSKKKKKGNRIIQTLKRYLVCVKSLLRTIFITLFPVSYLIIFFQVILITHAIKKDYYRGFSTPLILSLFFVNKGYMENSQLQKEFLSSKEFRKGIKKFKFLCWKNRILISSIVPCVITDAFVKRNNEINIMNKFNPDKQKEEEQVNSGVIEENRSKRRFTFSDFTRNRNSIGNLNSSEEEEEKEKRMKRRRKEGRISVSNENYLIYSVLGTVCFIKVDLQRIKDEPSVSTFINNNNNNNSLDDQFWMDKFKLLTEFFEIIDVCCKLSKCQKIRTTSDLYLSISGKYLKKVDFKNEKNLKINNNFSPQPKRRVRERRVSVMGHMVESELAKSDKLSWKEENNVLRDSISKTTEFCTSVRETLELFSGKDKVREAYKVDVKIGFCFGYFSAGIIGKSNFLFDVIGKTVNLSSRMCTFKNKKKLENHNFRNNNFNSGIYFCGNKSVQGFVKKIAGKNNVKTFENQPIKGFGNMKVFSVL